MTKHLLTYIHSLHSYYRLLVQIILVILFYLLRDGDQTITQDDTDMNLYFRITNLKYWANSEIIISKTLQLLNDLSVGYSSVRKLVKLDTVQFVLTNHNVSLLYMVLLQGQSVLLQGYIYLQSFGCIELYFKNFFGCMKQKIFFKKFFTCLIGLLLILFFVRNI